MRAATRSGRSREAREEDALQPAVAAAQHRQLHVLADEPGQRRGHQVDPLLLRQPPHHADERHLRPDRQAELLLQRRPCRPPCRPGRRPSSGPAGRGRVAGSHSSESMPLRMPVRSAARWRSTPSRPRRPRASGSPGRRSGDTVVRASANARPALHEGELVVELHGVRSGRRSRAAPGPASPAGEEPLVGEVVDGEDGPRPGPGQILGVLLPEQEGTRPVCQSLRWTMRGRSPSAAGRGQRRPRQVGEPLGVVAVVAVGVAVEAAARAEVPVVLDEVERDPGPLPGPEGGLLPPHAHRPVERLRSRAAARRRRSSGGSPPRPRGRGPPAPAGARPPRRPARRSWRRGRPRRRRTGSPWPDSLPRYWATLRRNSAASSGGTGLM